MKHGEKMRKQKEVIIERYEPDYLVGLNNEQIKNRKENKLINKVPRKNSKSYLGIICTNTFTFFNLIWAVIIGAYIYVGSFNNLLFSVVIILNTLIAIIQECKAKRTVDKLSLLTSPSIKTIRNGKELDLHSKDLLLDDIIILNTGNQIPADCILINGKVEVNESLLTGESNPIKKEVNSTLLAGSFIVSGTCYAKIDKIGTQSYIQTLAQEAKKFKNPASNLFRDLNKIIKYIGIAIVPVAVILYISNATTSPDFNTTIIKTCGALTGMVPAGMFLLVTIALAVGVVKLSQKKTLVQDIYSIEMLARTDILCLDKTGTITDGTMNVTDVEYLTDIPNIENLISSHLNQQSSNNATECALIQYFGNDLFFNPKQKLDFSSDRKYSATSFENIGTFVVGAPEFACKNLSNEIKDKILLLNNQSKRVLLVAFTNEDVDIEAKSLNTKTIPVALISIEDHIREDAIETIKWFKDNDVDVKIISGDSPETVSSIAKRVGVENSDQCVSLEGMSLQDVASIADKFTIFGRVSPEQKHHLVKTLKNKGHVVAMTGDGVNDTLALKEADCSVAMADGSDVAKGISKLVLMDSKFSSLPNVVKEGRQVINNIQKSSTLFLMKTFFTFMFALFVIFIHSTYPFESVSLILLEVFVIGIPSFILALEPNERKITGEFITTVLKKAIPSALVLFFNVSIVMLLNKSCLITASETESLAVITLTLTGFLNLIRICYPFNKLRIATLILSITLITASSLALPEFFHLTHLSGTCFIILGIIVAYTIPLVCLLNKAETWVGLLFTKNKKLKKKNKKD